jgi:hypothetical protein
MKKLIKFLTIVLCLVLLSSCMLACGEKGDGDDGDGQPTYTASEGLELELTNNDEESFAIVKGIGTCSDSVIYLPETYQGVKVTAISSTAFMDVTSASKIVFSKNITSVYGADDRHYDDNAFKNCTADVDMSLATEMTFISHNVFREFKGKSVILPPNITGLSSTVFQRSSITSITIPASVISIAYNCFENCTQLATVTFESGSQLQYLGSGNGSAFMNCTSLAEITLPAGIIEYGWSIFAGCTTDVKWDGPITKLVGRDGDASIFSYYAKETFIIPSTVTELGEEVFYDCDCTYVVIPTAVTKIGKLAFGFNTTVDRDNLPVPYILYAGNQAQWEAIETNGKIYYEEHTKVCFYNENPTEAGAWWKYNANGNPQVQIID